MKPIIISLCDLTGSFTAPFIARGWEALHVDPQREHNGTILEMMPTIRAAIETGRVRLVAGWPPCTDVAVSGARHFEAKREADPHFQAKAALIAEQCRMVGEMAGCPWFFENPVSVFASIFGKPCHTFNPNEYGGYLPKDDQHPLYPDYFPPRDAYTKKTCLWTGGGFQMPERKPVPVVQPEDGSLIWGKLGGKSLKTKNIRSASPRGFAIAVCESLTRGRALVAA